jgi:hypothetical protein
MACAEKVPRLHREPDRMQDTEDRDEILCVGHQPVDA